MKTELDVMIEVMDETYRFQSKLNKAIEVAGGNENIASGYTRNKYVAAVKRSALDLKQELTKLTQCLKYREEN